MPPDPPIVISLQTTVADFLLWAIEHIAVWTLGDVLQGVLFGATSLCLLDLVSCGLCGGRVPLARIVAPGVLLICFALAAVVIR